MKLRSSIALILSVFVSIALFSQSYTVKFHSGHRTPPANAGEISIQALSNARFGDRFYLNLQFTGIPDADLLSRLQSFGIRLIDYLPDYCYTTSLPANIDLAILPSLNVRSVFTMTPAEKSAPSVFDLNIPPHAVKQQGYADLAITTMESEEAITATIISAGGFIMERYPQFRNIIARIPFSSINQLVAHPYVMWVEPVDPPNQAENLLGRTLHRVNVLNDGIRNLKGDGINIAIWDEGEVSPHLDFTPIGSRLNQMETSSASSHSTHCAGTFGGRGLINYRARGMAPNSTIYSYNFNGNIANEMSAAIPSLGLHVSSHSYGGTATCGLTGASVAYSTTSRNTDINLNNFPTHLHVHSSGNSQGSCSGGWSTITGSGKTAKNNILVANITSSETLSSSSSCGPVADGRVKPEISAFGTNVLSTYTPLNNYGTISGTSMATPGVSGSVALLVQRYQQLNANANPISSLIKNAICNTAHDLGTAGPDYRFGFGRINALSAVKIIENNTYAVNTLNNLEMADVTINVPAGTTRLKVMLTWNDPAATANANPSLVNNLDLSVIGSSGTVLPWILDPNNPSVAATQGIDVVSNIEQVTIDNPASGSYTLRVNATAVAVGPQQYSLTWFVEQPMIEIIYPNGNESLEPGTNETITWDHSGITGNQTVAYSLDNGNNWTNISTSVPSSTTRLIWAVPTGANTSQALVRVSAGSLSDQSDQNFKILGIPANFNTGASCLSGSIVFTWNATTNATHYDILSLDMNSGQWNFLEQDVAGTTHTENGLAPGASMWFTIVAKNNTSGAIGERALAINRIVSSSGLSSIGNISGLDNICGAASGVQYTVAAVSGATNYSWTVPPNAVIIAGQGTNTITVDFPSNTMNGNVSVFASAGSCQTATSSLAIVFGSTVAAPTSGGNQSVTSCPPNPIPTLTATASVPSGHSVIWYDAAVGGNVISSPNLNAYGTITYYAATRNNSSGCESASRTAVTLTIVGATAATVSANGPTTFCEGGSVMLTASSGQGYSWSNGATSPSITVTTSGNYSVTVNQGNGCFSTTSPISVTVNEIPPTSITASGNTTFCEGESVVLTATPGAAYAWSNGATTQSISVSASGNYNVAVTHSNGCTSSSTNTAVIVNPRPVVSVSAVPLTSLLPGLSTTLTANFSSQPQPVSISWTRDGGPISNSTQSINVNVNQLGAYQATVTNGAGCSAASSVLIVKDSASNRLFIYPNPNSGVFNVSFYNGSGSEKDQVISMYDTRGRLVYRRNYRSEQPYEIVEVNAGKLQSGQYFLVLREKNGKKLAAASVMIGR